ncbi:MAG: hypothetical protein N2749_04255 [Clostridia bacterium]|nr:hypothetical protein [Clostridia bacterium]
MNKDIVEKAADISEGCMGAFGAVYILLQAGEHDVIKMFHKNNIIGKKAYWFWEKVCERDISNMKKICRAIGNGISNEELHKNLPEYIYVGVDEKEIMFFRNLAGITISS